MVFGQHFRALVPRTGSGDTYMMPLSSSVLEVPTTRPDGDTAALMVTHLVTDYPMETHVFNSLLSRQPLYVGTRRGIWCVDGDKISLISTQPPGGLG